MNQLLQRIKTAYHLETDAEVADFLGINPSTLSMQKNRGNLDLARIINKCQGLNMNWLLHGEGPVKLNGNTNKSDIPVYYHSNQLKNGQENPQDSAFLKIPFLGSEKDLANNGFSELRGIKGYRIMEDAMAPTLQKDDVAIINTEENQPIDGNIFLLKFNGTMQCRRIKDGPNNHYLLSSDNEKHESLEMKNTGDNFIVIGKVAMLIRRF